MQFRVTFMGHFCAEGSLIVQFAILRVPPVTQTTTACKRAVRGAVDGHYQGMWPVSAMKAALLMTQDVPVMGVASIAQVRMRMNAPRVQP